MNFLCCCYDFGDNKRNLEISRRKEKKSKKQQTLDKIKELKTSIDRPKVWDISRGDPNRMKTTEMANTFTIPSDDFKTEDDVLQSLGYKMSYFIDRGGFAEVHKVIHIETKLNVALKKIPVPEELDYTSQRKRMSLLSDIKNELCVFENITHPHIIKMIDHFVIIKENQMTFYILMQFAAKGTLSKKLDQFGPFSERTCKVWFAQMLSALLYMHSKGFAHRDLKLSNILLDDSEDILISDFGLSRLVWRQSQDKQLMSKTYCGTPPYMAPEVLVIYTKRGATYEARAADIWSLGVILYKLFTKEYPFPLTRAKAIKYMKHKRWQFSDKDNPSEDMKDILTKMFDPNPNSRPLAPDLCKHKWIKHAFDSVEQKSVRIING